MSGVSTGEIILGIDLGTTNSVVAVAGASGPRVLHGDYEHPSMPSVVRYEGDSVVVGDEAKRGAVEHPRTTVASVKRLMGRSVADAAEDLKYLSYQVTEGPQETSRVALPGGRELAPEQVSAEVLKALKARAEAVLGQSVSKAVVTVPAYFDDAQRQATRNAGRLAGLEVVRIVNEPTAAALAYGVGLERDAARNRGQETVAVYDLGGGTFDVSILRVVPSDDGDEPAFYEVLATAGDTRLGGDDVDHLLIEVLFAELRDAFGIDAESVESLPAETRRALKSFAEGMKHRLSTEESAQARIDLGGGRVLEHTVTREGFEAMIAPWIERSIAACDRALRDAKRKLGGGAGKIDRVILVGGSTRIPAVRRAVAERFGAEPYTALDPDLVVGMGAAVQGAILAGEHASGLLLDVIPLSLGLETAGGAVAKLIVRNTPVPTRAVETFSTGVDGQTSIKLNVLQGEREMAEDCRSLGAFHLAGLPPMPAGIPKLEVEFLVDANGVLTVHATEARSGKRARLQVVPNHGLTEDEVDRMEAESLEFALEDMTRHRVVDLVANSELDLKWIGERLEKHRAKLEAVYAEELTRLRDGLAEFVARAKRDWRSVDASAFAAAKQTLDESSVRLQEVSITASLQD